MSYDMQPQPWAIQAQPTNFNTLAPGAVPVDGVSVRTLRDTPEDAEFAGRLVIEAFRGKIAHAITDRKLPIAVKNQVASHRGQHQAFYNRTFVAEYYGKPAGIVQIKFKGDTETDRDDHLNELGCWHFCRYACLGCFTATDVEKRSECYVDHICVDETARGKGVGKVLMQRAEYEARLRNCSVIFLYVLTTNRAQNLYTRQGYRITSRDSCCGCLGCFLGPPGSVYKMEKNLYANESHNPTTH